jgi:hypothetical protein
LSPLTYDQDGNPKPNPAKPEMKIEYWWYSIYFISHPSSKSDNQITDTQPAKPKPKFDYLINIVTING